MSQNNTIMFSNFSKAIKVASLICLSTAAGNAPVQLANPAGVNVQNVDTMKAAFQQFQDTMNAQNFQIKQQQAEQNKLIATKNGEAERALKLAAEAKEKSQYSQLAYDQAQQQLDASAADERDKVNKATLEKMAKDKITAQKEKLQQDLKDNEEAKKKLGIFSRLNPLQLLRCGKKKRLQSEEVSLKKQLEEVEAKEKESIERHTIAQAEAEAVCETRRKVQVVQMQHKQDMDKANQCTTEKTNSAANLQKEVQMTREWSEKVKNAGEVAQKGCENAATQKLAADVLTKINIA